MSVPILTIIGDAATEINWFGPGATIPTTQSNWALGKANRILDNWNDERDAVWCDIFTEFTFTPSLNPHTIGPSGATWTMAIRPVTLDGCSLNLNGGSPNVYIPITILTEKPYEALPTPGISTSIPVAVYYEKDWPNGKLYFYPVPQTAYKARLLTRTLLSQLTIGQSIDFPPGYRDALTLTLAEDLATGAGRLVPPMLERRAREARHRIFVNNLTVPDINACPQGLQPDGGGPISYFNYHSRTWNP